MNKIVRENYPAKAITRRSCAPAMIPNARVTVTIEEEEQQSRAMLLSLEEIFSQKGFPLRTKEDIDADIRRQRDEWDD